MPEPTNFTKLSFSDSQAVLHQLPESAFKEFVKRVIKVNKIESVKATIALSNSIVENMNNDWNHELNHSILNKQEFAL